jgi:hypothetical protein
MSKQAAERAVAMGEEDFRATPGFFRVVLSKMGSLPGQRVLILISPGFLTFSDEAVALKSQVLEMAASSQRGYKRHRRAWSLYYELGIFTKWWRLPSMPESGTKTGPSPCNPAKMLWPNWQNGSGGTHFHDNNNLRVGLTSMFSGHTSSSSCWVARNGRGLSVSRPAK